MLKDIVVVVAGEGGEELPEGEKLDGDEDSGSMTSGSPGPGDEEANSPAPGDLPSPRSSIHEDATLLLPNHIVEKYVYYFTICS